MSRDRYWLCDDTCTTDCGACKGAGRPAEPTAAETNRAWLWQHTAQPNGDPWDADPEALDQAAADLAAAIGTEA